MLNYRFATYHISHPHPPPPPPLSLSLSRLHYQTQEVMIHTVQYRSRILASFGQPPSPCLDRYNSHY